MRLMVVTTALLLWISPALAEQKSGPDGFGPIKFGMTKDEAWEAIGGQGEWVEDVLVHKVGLPGYLKPFYEVKQRFDDGHADRVVIQNPESRSGFIMCATDLAFMLGSITTKYGVAPVKIDFESGSSLPPRVEQVTVYQFYYRDNAYVHAYFTRVLQQQSRGRDELSCEVEIRITSPSPGYSDGF